MTPVVTFSADDQGYWDWRNANPTGFVATSLGNEYAKIHKVGCSALHHLPDNVRADDPHTTAFRKVCCANEAELMAATGITRRCQFCSRPRATRVVRSTARARAPESRKPQRSLAQLMALLATAKRLGMENDPQVIAFRAEYVALGGFSL